MTKMCYFLCFSLLLLGCGNSAGMTRSAEKGSAINAASTGFDGWVDTFLLDYWRHFPERALYRGYYRYDARQPLPDAVTRNRNLAFLYASSETLERFDPQSLPAQSLSDYLVLKNRFERELWNVEELKSFAWRPDRYNIAQVLGRILNAQYKPLEDRLITVSRRLLNVPAYYAAARISLTDPTLVHTELALQQNLGARTIFDELLPQKLEKSGLSMAQRTLLERRMVQARRALDEHIRWLEATRNRLQEEGGRSFRIGKDLFDRKFELELAVESTPEQVYQKALVERKRVLSEMKGLTRKLWPKYFPDTVIPENSEEGIRKMIDRVSLDHVRPDEFVDAVRNQLPQLKRFVREHDLITLDETRPLVVRETPPFMRGFAGASIQAPGPYDATSNTYYNVTPLDDYTAEKAESYLREYNNRMLQILNIHEAIRGHYTQLVYANKSPSLVKSLFGNGAMVEGWALYAERMMLEAGYGGGEPELWLLYYKWYLRSIINTLLDRDVHVNLISRQDALDMMIHQGFQEVAEAEAKWRRATLSQVQLSSYFTGFSEIYAFRQELKQALGDRFSLREFHDRFLSYGSMPVKYIKMMMRKDLGLAPGWVPSD